MLEKSVQNFTCQHNLAIYKILSSISLHAYPCLYSYIDFSNESKRTFYSVNNFCKKFWFTFSTHMAEKVTSKINECILVFVLGNKKLILHIKVGTAPWTSCSMYRQSLFYSQFYSWDVRRPSETVEAPVVYRGNMLPLVRSSCQKAPCSEKLLLLNLFN